MLLFIVLQTDSTEYELFSYVRKIDINRATVEELSEIPFLTDDDIQKIISKRPFKSIDEVSKVLKLSDIEKKALENVAFVSRKLHKFSGGFVVSSDMESVRYLAKLYYNDFYIRLHGRWDTLTFRLHLKSIVFGNFRISMGNGLITGYRYANNYTSIRTDRERLAILLNTKGFILFYDTAKNYFLSYGTKVVRVGIVGKDSFNIYTSLNTGIFTGEILLNPRGFKGYSMGLIYRTRGIYMRAIYKNLLSDVWDISKEGKYFGISFSYSNNYFSIKSFASTTYNYNALYYRITSTSKLYIKVLKNGFKLGFLNKEPLKVELTNYTYGTVLSIKLWFISAYIYDTQRSIYIYDEYMQLYSSGFFVKGKGSAISLNVKYRFFKLKYMNNSFWLSVSYRF